MHHKPLPKGGMALLCLAFLLFFSTNLFAQPTIVTADPATGSVNAVHTLTSVPAGALLVLAPFDPEESEVEQRVFYIDEFRIGDENATYNDVAPEELLPVLRRGVPAVESGVTRFSLGQNYPNPFGISTMIRYELPKSSHVNLSVYDLNGRVVKVLVNGTRSAGVHTIRLDGGGLAKGVYY